MTLHHEHIPGHAPHRKTGKKGQMPPPPPLISAKTANRSPDKATTIDEGLQAIYGDDRSDLQTVNREPRSFTKLLSRAVLALAIIAGLSYAAFFVYTTFLASPKDDRPLVMSIEAPQDIKSGEPVTVTINYQNPRRVPLASLVLDVNLPTAFELTKAEPTATNTDTLEWTVGSLGPQSDNKIVLQGIWLTSVPSTTTIQVLAHYRPANFNADFSDIATANVTTIASTGTLELHGAENASAGASVDFQGVITNTGTEIMSAPVFTLQLPTGFILTSSVPTLPAGNEPRWQLPDIAPGAQATVAWSGTFAADAADVAQFTGQLLLTDNSLDLLQASGDWFVNVAKSSLGLTLVANGTSDRATTSAGDVLRVSVRLENSSSSPLIDTSILLDFQPSSGIPLDWDKASLAGGTLAADGVHFSATAIGGLAAGDKKTLNLSFPVLSTPPVGAADSWTITAFATHDTTTVQTTPLSIQLNAAPKVTAEARYFSASGAPLGGGPLPPAVGQTTTYRFFWQVSPSLHDLENVQLTAVLPPNVTWSDQVMSSHGNVSFDEATRTVRWSVALLPSGETGSAEFSLAAKPSPADADTFMKLLSATSFVAKDGKTGTSLAAEAAELTSELPTDPGAAGKGAVIGE